MKSPRFVLFFALFCLSALPLFGAQEGTFDRTLKVSGAVDLDVTTGSGAITVNRGTDSQVIIHAVIRASNNWLFSMGDASDRIKQIQDKPPIEQSGNVIRIGHSYDSSLFRNISISYDIQVPADTRLHTHTGSGSIKIGRVNGPVEATTGSGGIDINDVGSDARLQTGSGGIVVSGVAGTVRAHTGSGSIDGTRIGGKTEGTAVGRSYLDFETGSGGIRLRDIAGELKAHTGSGSIEAQGQQMGDWDINTGSGGVRVRLPENSKFTLMARTSSGSVSTDFPLTIQGTVNRRELSGSVNGGGHRLEIHTASGSIHIEK